MTQEIQIRALKEEDNPYIRELIIKTLAEFGATGGGFASSDEDTMDMFRGFAEPDKKYLVVLMDGIPKGGAGYAPLPGEDQTCELVKMYFHPDLRGKGYGRKIITRVMKEAKEAGYTRMYLETLENMSAARHLYVALGFTQIDQAMGDTGHHGCDTFYIRDL